MFRKLNSRNISVTVCVIFFLGMFHVSELHSYSSPLDQLEEWDQSFVETGIILFDHALNRIWSVSGSPEGNIGLLDRAARVSASIANPAARYYLLARVALYKGRVIKTIERNSRARPYFKEAMELAAKSISFRESAEAYRVQAEAGYDWMLTKRLGGKSKMMLKIQGWIDSALKLDSRNAQSLIIRAQLNYQSARGKKVVFTETVQMLENLVTWESLDDIQKFQAQVLIAKINGKMRKNEQVVFWCKSAAEVYPKNPMVQDCY